MNFFSEHLLLTVFLWIVIYTLDYTFTRIVAGWYEAGGKQHLFYERGIELTPIHQRDIALLRWISPRFLLLLALTSLGLWWFGRSSNLAGTPEMFEFLVGAWFLAEGAMHTRHLRNLALFYYIKDSRGIQGNVQYAMWLSYRTSAVDALAFSLLYFAIYWVVGRPFLLGGALACGALALFHWLLSFRELKRKAKPSSAGPQV